MHERSLRTLDFDKVLARLASLTSFSAGRRLAESVRPLGDVVAARRAQATVAETRRLQEAKPNLGLGGAHDVSPYAQKASLGGVLEPRELLEIQSTLQAARTWAVTLERLGPSFGLLQSIAARIDPLAPLAELIGRSITQTAEVADSASPALGAIRREVRIAHDRLSTRMQEILNSPAGRLAAQEPLITERDGRYVIPVKADMRGQLRGIVHDVSSSGATLFIEPLAVVDLGNRWREVQHEEQREVERILRALSEAVGTAAGQVAADVEALAEFDLLFAKVRLGEALRARELPATGHEQTWLAEAGELRLVNARHPLLTGRVVPISLNVGGRERVLLITGPNTGGKTVALKTAGLLTLTALAGLPVPAEFGSQVPFYHDVFADIGDEQSIEQSLSTFSSHMRNVIEVLGAADSGTLVLLDELGAGTDPEEGAALAIAIVEYLLERGATVIATTHHGPLKLYAHQREGVQNASVEFDEETLAPTYELSIGVPGRSNAIAIARRLGMPGEVLERAQASIAPEKAELDSLLKDLQRQRDEAEAARAAEIGARREAEEVRDRLRERLAEVEAERSELIENTAFEMERELEGLREQLRRAARRAQETATPAPAALAPIEEAREIAAEAAEAPKRLRRRLEGPVRRRRPVMEPAAIRPGDQVWIRGLESPGEAVAAVDERGELEVLLGNLRTRVRVSQVERTSRPLRAPAERTVLRAADAAAPSEIEIRAQRVDEALPRLEQFLDQAFRTGLPRVRIIHGKGTGTLRRAVRDVLSEHPLVTSYETAAREEGGEGVTVAHLAV